MQSWWNRPQQSATLLRAISVIFSSKTGGALTSHIQKFQSISSNVSAQNRALVLGFKQGGAQSKEDPNQRVEIFAANYLSRWRT